MSNDLNNVIDINSSLFPINKDLIPVNNINLSKKMRFINMAKYLSNDLTTNMIFFSKTKMCSNYECNKCTFGDKCKFAHSKDELVDQTTLPCLYGPYCITESCNRKHYTMEQTVKIHNHIYNVIKTRKTDYKSSIRQCKKNNCNLCINLKHDIILKNSFETLS